MAKAEAKVDYDSENDVLWVYTGKKVRDSLEMDKFVLDFSPDDKIVGVEIIDASKTISNISFQKITKGALSNIKNASINVYPSKELVFISLALVLTIGDSQTEISVP